MNYSVVAGKINENISSLSNIISNIKAIDFGNIWSGDVYNKRSSELINVVSKMEKQKNFLSSFVSALEKLQSYQENYNEINNLNSMLDSILDIPGNYSRRSEINISISKLRSDNESLKSSIDSLVGSIESISSELEVIKFDVNSFDSYDEYMLDITQLLEKFQSGSLSKIKNGISLYDYYSKSEVDAKINQIKSQYKGRDAAVNCALGVMEMAADVGLKLDYDWGGGHTAVTDIDHIANGVDCSSFASWAINQGASSTFETKTASGLLNVGNKVSYEDAQKGDILVYSNNESDHVVMIVDNAPETKQFLVAEAANSNAGVVMRTRSYSSLYGTYQARDLSDIYNS